MRVFGELLKQFLQYGNKGKAIFKVPLFVNKHTMGPNEVTLQIKMCLLLTIFLQILIAI